MKRRTLICMALAASVIWSLPARAADDADTLRMLRAENKMLRSQVESLKKQMEALKDQVAKLQEQNKALAERAEKTPAQTSAKPSPTESGAAKTPKKDSPFVAGPVTKGDFQIGVLGAAVAQTPLFNEITGDRGRGENKHLILLVGVTNTSESKKVDYRTWGADAFKFMGSSASLVDDLGNSYKRIHFGATEQPVGRTKSASIYPGKSMTDVLVFEPPIGKAKTLTLTLPMANLDQGEDSGEVKIQIPVAGIKTD